MKCRLESKHKFYKYIHSVFTMSPLFVVACSQPVIPENIVETPEINIENADQIFPEINISEYYDLITFEKHQPQITDELILQVIKDVIKKVSTSYGKIYFDIHQISLRNVNILFKWEYNNQILYRNYQIQI